ncbi:MAG: polysaccharide deacetylase family protein [Burkholderiales bacterium]
MTVSTALLSRPWQPTPFVKASFALHAAAAVAVGAAPPTWPWALAAVAANQALIGGAVMWPRSTWIGENIRRLPPSSVAKNEIALTFDDGPDPEITPRVLDLLDAMGQKASFYVVGARAIRYPRVIQAIVKRGHAVENHSQHHANGFAFYSLSRLHRELDAAQQAIYDTASSLPRFFRAPMGFRTPFLDPVIARLGLHYSSWTRRGFDSMANSPAPVLQRLVTGLQAGDILLLHDGSMLSARRERSIALEVLPELLKKISDRGLKSVALRHAFRDVLGER